jgi:hypothetical protein
VSARLPFAWGRGILAAAGLVLLATAARADAPGIQYDLFDISAPIIHDKWTNLYWQRKAPPAAGLTLAGAVQYCDALVLGSGTMATGWRLPSYKELQTLIDETPHDEFDPPTLSRESKWIDDYAFGGEDANSFYWTSSLYPLDSSKTSYYYVDFMRAATGATAASTRLDVRCVHDP